MVRLFSYMAGVMFFSSLLLLLVDTKIYRVRGWERERKASVAAGWIYGVLSVLALVLGMLIFV